MKNELIDEETFARRAETPADRVLAEAYAEYQRRLRRANAFDFDDLIGSTVALLQLFPDVAEHYRRRFRHILVDEYQDTNHAQYVLVRELVGDGTAGVPPGELCVVGDADQSIYAFRGATIRNIEEFERDYPDAKTVLLEQNYRSTQTILDAANRVIARNGGRRAKRLWTDAGAGKPIVTYVADDEHDEARFVADEIDALVDDAGVRPADVAVFYRTNAQSRSLEEIFVRVGLPYTVVGSVRFYERREIRDAVAYLRAIANPDDDVSVRRILNVPKRGIGDRAEEVIEASRSASASPLELPWTGRQRSRGWRRDRRRKWLLSPSCSRTCARWRRQGRVPPPFSRPFSSRPDTSPSSRPRTIPKTRRAWRISLSSSRWAPNTSETRRIRAWRASSSACLSWRMPMRFPTTRRASSPS